MPRPVVRRPFVNKEPKQKTLFDLDPPQTDEELARELLGDMGGHTQIEGKTAKEQLKTIDASYENKSKISLDDYCRIVYEWLLLNKDCFSVLEYYEEPKNRPFAYPLEDVETNERIKHLLEQRIINLCLTGKQKYGFGISLLVSKYGWLTSRTTTADKPEAPTNDNTDITFKFGT